MEESSSQTNTNVTFDLSSQVGVLQALYAVRTSELSSSKKNELRDDIFTYTKSGGDTRMREQLEAQLKQIPLSKEFLTKKATAKPQKESAETGLNTGRQAPRFSVPSTPSSFTPQSVQDESAVSEVLEATPQPNQEKPAQPAASNEVRPTVASAPAPATPQQLEPAPTSTPPSVADNQRVNQSPQTSQPTQSTQPTQPNQLTQTNQTPQQAVVPEPMPAPAESGAGQPAQTNIDTSINRIREIKRAVNNAVGNPVNLVDIDNTLGRQYMSALLKAMQSVSAENGAAGPTEMQELENAYQAITPILNREAHTSQVTEASKQSTVPPASPEPRVQADQSAPEVEQKPASASEPTNKTFSQNQPAPSKSPATPFEESAPVIKREVPISSIDQSDNSKTANDGAVEAKPKPSQNYPEPNSQTTTASSNYQTENEMSVSVQSSTEQKTPVEQSISRVKETEPKTEPAIATAPSNASEIPADNVPTKPETQTKEAPEASQRKDSGSFKILPIADEEEGSEVDYGSTQRTPTRKAPMPEELTTTPTAEKTPLTSSAAPASQIVNDASVGKTESAPEPKNQAEQKPPVPPKENFQPTPSLKQQTEGKTIDAKLDTLKKQNQSQQAKTDPLFSPEIDAGLEHLLQEWSIFKSSGLFGTGPNGREHPLFKKIAPLMVQDVAAGRFEDARPEVVQSISDYMNGWRYEQGIVYQAGETFETYLRRVIKFILTGKP